MGKTHTRGTRAAQIEAYLRVLAEELGLRGWDVCFDGREPEDDCEACVTQYEDQHALIRVHPRFWAHEPGYQRLVLVHELCHLHFVGGDAARGALAAVLPGPAGDAVGAVLAANEERTCQAFTRLLCDQCPMPPRWVRK